MQKHCLIKTTVILSVSTMLSSCALLRLDDEVQRAERHNPKPPAAANSQSSDPVVAAQAEPAPVAATTSPDRSPAEEWSSETQAEFDQSMIDIETGRVDAKDEMARLRTEETAIEEAVVQDILIDLVANPPKTLNTGAKVPVVKPPEVPTPQPSETGDVGEREHRVREFDSSKEGGERATETARETEHCRGC